MRNQFDTHHGEDKTLLDWINVERPLLDHKIKNVGFDFKIVYDEVDTEKLVSFYSPQKENLIGTNNR